MTQEDKQLLLKDLCARLPYGVRIKAYGDNTSVLTGEHYDLLCTLDNIESLPYLRPMSSMTEEEATEIASICLLDLRNILSIKIKDEYLDITIDDGFSSIETITLWYDEMISSIECLYWLLEHHFDFMGLIPKGLAIDCSNLDIY